MLRDDGHRTAIALSLSILCLYLVLAIALHFFGISHVDAYKLDDLITTDVIHEDQTTSYYPGNVFTPPLKSDTLYVHIPLPKKRWVPSAMLCFSYYNARVQIYAADNRVIYSSTASDLISDGVTGHMIVKATIPNNCWGKALDVRIEPLEDNTTFVISGVYVLRSYDSVWYPVLLAGQFTYTGAGSFGLAFDYSGRSDKYKMISVSPADGKLKLLFNEGDTPIAESAIDLEEGKTYSFRYLQEGSVGLFCIDGVATLTVRVYGVSGKTVRLFAENTTVTFSELREYTHG